MEKREQEERERRGREGEPRREREAGMSRSRLQTSNPLEAAASGAQGCGPQRRAIIRDDIIPE